MNSSQNPFAGNTYVTGVQTTATAPAPPPQGPAAITPLSPPSLAMEGQTPIIKIEQARYGTGKPKRIVIKGKILRG
jgi:hypothetical protein